MDKKQDPPQESKKPVNNFALWFFFGAMVVSALAIAYAIFFRK